MRRSINVAQLRLTANFKMDSTKYLIIITLIDGQNFTVPDGLHDKSEAYVFAEARFGNESILRSDPIKLTNSNPEFVTELAWQLDKRSLHQLRVERRAIKLQIFLQIREKKVSKLTLPSATSNGSQSMDSSETNKVELIGYTVLDIRSAQDRDQPKFQWLPLLNPKFRKSSYNRPEVQLAVTLSRIDDTPPNAGVKQSRLKDLSALNSNSDKFVPECSVGMGMENLESDADSSIDSRLYKTCLDISHNQANIEGDEIIDNDINIICENGSFYIYDTRDPSKPSIHDCDEHYKITVTLPFSSDLDSLVSDSIGCYYFSVSIFGTSSKTKQFDELTSVETKEIYFDVFTTHSGVLKTYFELNSNLVIKLHQAGGGPLGIATIQLDQLCSIDTKHRSIEGIFALQSMSEQDTSPAVHPTIGVSVTLERLDDEPRDGQETNSIEHGEVSKEHYDDEMDDYVFKSFNDTHQLTFDETNVGQNRQNTFNEFEEAPVEQNQEDHHYCFTIDLKSFSYTPDQRLIPTLRELVVRYSYPFFGYKDTITTDASIPISPTNSIIVSGFCEFNFATNRDSLLTALREVPLELDILTCDQTKRIELGDEIAERVVATCSLNLAETMGLTEASMKDLREHSISKTTTASIHALDCKEIGDLQVFLGLKDLGPPMTNLKASTENLDRRICREQDATLVVPSSTTNSQKLDAFMLDIKQNIECWKGEYIEKLAEEMRKRESERFKRLTQRLEAREAKREHEYRKKMDDLSCLEKRFKNSLLHIESLERNLSSTFDQMKTKDALLDTRIETIDLKISKAISDIKLECERRLESLPVRNNRFTPDHPLESKSLSKIAPKPNSDLAQARRSSLRGTCMAAGPGIPLPIRSSSLVRGPTDGASTRLVKRPTGMVTTVINGVSSRQRTNSSRLNLSKETQEKLASLRREKAELLKRGCRPNDDLIQEINSLIEKLAC